jgi:adenosylhomocysteine nucleosidase
MHIGVMSSVKEEITSLKTEMTIEKTEVIGLREYTTGVLSGKKCTLVFSRWGKVSASTTASVLIERFAVDLIVFTGFAGAVSESVSVGDWVVADSCIQYDLDVSALSGAKHGVPLLGVSQFPTDKKISDLVIKSIESSGEKTTVHNGLIASGDHFISNANEILELRSNIKNALCVETEGAAVAQIGYEYATDVVLCRLISDSGDDSAADDFYHFSANGGIVSLISVVKQILQDI